MERRILLQKESDIAGKYRQFKTHRGTDNGLLVLVIPAEKELTLIRPYCGIVLLFGCLGSGPWHHEVTLVPLANNLGRCHALFSARYPTT